MVKLLHLEEEFNISVETFYAFFFESQTFKQRYHTSRGDNSIEVKPWTPLSTGGYTREVCFCSFISNNPVINRLVGDKAKVREVQKYIFKGESILNVTSETFFEGSSIGKSFQAETEWNVIPSINKSVGCKVTIDVKNNYNGSMFKSVLENWVHDTTEASFKHWLNLVRQQVEEYEQSEKLKRAAPTPVKQPPHGTTASVSSTVAPQQQLIQPIVNMNGKNGKNVVHQGDQDGDDTIQHRQKRIIRNQQHNHHPHHHHHHHVDENHSKMNGGSWESESERSDYDNNDDDDDLSEFSNPPAINEDFLNETSDRDEYEDEEDIEGESGEDQFYDSNDQIHHNMINGDLKNYMVQLTNELNSMKSIVEVNHTRLLGLETAFSQLQLSRANTTSASPNAAVSTNGGKPADNHSTHQLSHTSTAMINGIKLSSYVANLEELVKNHQEEEYKSKEYQKDLEAKAKELEERLNDLNKSSKRISWFNALSIVFLVVGWPIVSRKLFVLVTNLLANLKK